MVKGMRSFSQKIRHAQARKAQEDCRKLIELLERQEKTLKGALKELRATLREVRGY